VIVKGLDAKPIDERLHRLLDAHGVVYLHKSSGGLDGWTASPHEQPEDPLSPETIELRRRIAPLRG
jgi:hypothetical protein